MRGIWPRSNSVTCFLGVPGPSHVVTLRSRRSGTEMSCRALTKLFLFGAAQPQRRPVCPSEPSPAPADDVCMQSMRMRVGETGKEGRRSNVVTVLSGDVAPQPTSVVFRQALTKRKQICRGGTVCVCLLHRLRRNRGVAGARPFVWRLQTMGDRGLSPGEFAGGPRRDNGRNARRRCLAHPPPQAVAWEGRSPSPVPASLPPERESR